MAIWLEGQESITDNHRKLGGGAMTRYGADADVDIALLPLPNGQNQGSTCFTLTGSLYKLGTNPAVGVNGWVKL